MAILVAAFFFFFSFSPRGRWLLARELRPLSLAAGQRDINIKVLEFGDLSPGLVIPLVCRPAPRGALVWLSQREGAWQGGEAHPLAVSATLTGRISHAVPEREG